LKLKTLTDENFVEIAKQVQESQPATIREMLDITRQYMPGNMATEG